MLPLPWQPCDVRGLQQCNRLAREVDLAVIPFEGTFTDSRKEALDWRCKAAHASLRTEAEPMRTAAT